MSWEQWEVILAEITARSESRKRIDPTNLPTDDLTRHLEEGFRDRERLQPYGLDLIGELADRRIGEWLDSEPDLPGWFVVGSAESVPAGS